MKFADLIKFLLLMSHESLACLYIAKLLCEHGLRTRCLHNPSLHPNICSSLPTEAHSKPHRGFSVRQGRPCTYIRNRPGSHGSVPVTLPGGFCSRCGTNLESSLRSLSARILLCPRKKGRQFLETERQGACALNGCSLLSKGQCSSVKQPGQAWHSLLRFWLNVHVSDEESLGSALMGSVPMAGNYSQCNRISPKLDIPKPLEHTLSRLFRTHGSIHAVILLANGQNIPREREIRCSVVS